MTRRKGIHCPQCLRGDQHPYSRTRPLAGLRVRYFKCPFCECRFKTKERLEPPKPR